MALPVMQFRILDEMVTVVPGHLPDSGRLDQALPVLRSLDDQAVAVAARKHGQPISCRAGCAACCRIQPVPVAPAEAFALLLLVESLEPERQATIRARFADRVERLRAAGMIEPYLEGRATSNREVGLDSARRYIALGLSCPFLEADQCGIYDVRPFVCREYLVSSPSELCADPLHNPVVTVPLILTPLDATLNSRPSVPGWRQSTVPLVLALEFATMHRRSLEMEYPLAPLVMELIRNLFVMAHQRGSLIS